MFATITSGRPSPSTSRIETKFKRKRKATYKKTYEKSKKARELESIGK